MRTTLTLALLAVPLLSASVWAQSGTGANTGSSYNASSGMSASTTGSSGASGGNTTTTNFDSSAFQGRINSAVQRGQEYLRSNRLSTSGTTGNSVNGTFVGADLSDMRDFLGATKMGQARTRLDNIISGRSSTTSSSNRRVGTGTRRLSTSGGSSSSLTSGSRSGNASGGGDTGDSLRVMLRPEIEPLSAPRVSDAQLTARLQQQAQRRGPNSSLSVEVEDGVATLRGTVNCTHDCAVCQQIVALEPGVRQVKSLLTIVPVSQSQPQTQP